MKPFNLEQALITQRVVTRSGRKVSEIRYFPTLKPEQCVVAIIDGNLYRFNENGNYYDADEQSNLDLFLLPSIKTYWVNVYRNGESVMIGMVCDTESQANNLGKSSHDYIKTISFEVEE